MKAGLIEGAPVDVRASLLFLTSTILSQKDISLTDLPLNRTLSLLDAATYEAQEQTSGEGSNNEQESEHDIETLLVAQKGMINAIGQLALRSEFITEYPLNGFEIQTLLRWITAAQSQLQICALVAVGNMSYSSEQTAISLIKDTNVMNCFVEVLDTATNGLVLTSAFEALQMLARPIENRRKLGQHSVLEAIARSWTQEVDLQLCTSALHHTRLMLQGCLSNAIRFTLLSSLTNEPLVGQLITIFSRSSEPSIQLQCGLVNLELWHTILTNAEKLPTEGDGAGLHIEGLASETNEEARGGAEVVVSAGMGIPSLRHLIAKLCQSTPQILQLFQPVIQSGNSSWMTRAWLILALISPQMEGKDLLCDFLTDTLGLEAFRSILKGESDANAKASSNARFLLNDLIKALVCAPSSMHTYGC